MKVRFFIAGFVIALTIGSARCASFQNLDFETVKLLPGPANPGGDPLTNVILLNWTLYAGTNHIADPELALNYSGVDGVTAALLDFRQAQYTFTNFVGGNYAIYLHQDFVGDSPFAIAQIGAIPPNTKFLQFKVAGATGFRVTVNGITPSLVDSVPDIVLTPNQSAAFPNIGIHKIYDISAFAGEDVELRLTVGTIVNGGPFFTYGDGILDSITFLTNYARFDPPAAKLDTNGFTLSWASSPSSQFQVEVATNLPPVWQPIGSPVTSTTNTFNFTDSTVTNQPSGQRFYRLRTVP